MDGGIRDREDAAAAMGYPGGMRALVNVLLLLSLLPGVARPQAMLDEAQAATFRGVGRLNIAGNRHCTATLIAESLVLTAAHCLYNPLTGRRAPPGEMRFVAGQRRDEYAALRDVTAAATPSAYDFTRAPGPPEVRGDLALLTLDAPIPPEVAAPIRPARLAGRGPFRIIAYGRDRAYAASIRDGCSVLQADGEIAVLDCAVTFGVSGAPVFAAGAEGPEIVGVVSAMGEDAASGEIAFVVTVTPLLEELRKSLAPDR